MADKITDEALTILSTFPFERFSQLASKPKMGIPFVIDFESNNMYGERCPASPIPVKKRCKEVVNCLVDTYKITTGKTAPKAEVVMEKMATELKRWGIGLVGLGLLHFTLAHILSSFWGVILILSQLLIPCIYYYFNPVDIEFPRKGGPLISPPGPGVGELICIPIPILLCTGLLLLGYWKPHLDS